MLIRAIDFETTGVPTPDDPHAIVEIGWSDLEIDDDQFGSNGVSGYDDTLCYPGRPIPFEAMAIHHITDEMVKAWISPETGIELLGRPDYFAAHNADFERQFIKTETPFICTWKVALRIWPDLPSHSLQYLRYALALPVNRDLPMPHRAGPDAYLCALLLEKIIQQPSAPDFATMARWSNGHALMPRCPLFKHKGKKWEEVPTDYLDWIVNKPNDVAADVKANAKLELRKR